MTDLTNQQTHKHNDNDEIEATEGAQPAAANAGQPTRLLCEYQHEPLGIDVLQPRLSWWPGDDRPAELQTAYQLLAASHPELLRMDEGDLWDTGRMEGRETAQLEYDGKPLISGRKVFWKVRSFDSDGLPSPWSEPATETSGPAVPSCFPSAGRRTPTTTPACTTSEATTAPPQVFQPSPFISPTARPSAPSARHRTP